MAKRKASLRDTSTDESVVIIVADGGGDVSRRDIVRRLGQRVDLAAALQRLSRSGAIEVVNIPVPGRRPLSRIRLLGDAAKKYGAGFVRVSSKK
jgi:hypothetical protein